MGVVLLYQGSQRLDNYATVFQGVGLILILYSIYRAFRLYKMIKDRRSR